MEVLEGGKARVMAASTDEVLVPWMEAAIKLAPAGLKAALAQAHQQAVTAAAAPGASPVPTTVPQEAGEQSFAEHFMSLPVRTAEGLEKACDLQHTLAAQAVNVVVAAAESLAERDAQSHAQEGRRLFSQSVMAGATAEPPGVVWLAGPFIEADKVHPPPVPTRTPLATPPSLFTCHPPQRQLPFPHTPHHTPTPAPTCPPSHCPCLEAVGKVAEATLNPSFLRQASIFVSSGAGDLIITKVTNNGLKVHIKVKRQGLPTLNTQLRPVQLSRPVRVGATSHTTRLDSGMARLVAAAHLKLESCAELQFELEPVDEDFEGFGCSSQSEAASSPPAPQPRQPGGRATAEGGGGAGGGEGGVAATPQPAMAE